MHFAGYIARAILIFIHFHKNFKSRVCFQLALTILSIAPYRYRVKVGNACSPSASNEAARVADMKRTADDRSRNEWRIGKHIAIINPVFRSFAIAWHRFDIRTIVICRKSFVAFCKIPSIEIRRAGGWQSSDDRNSRYPSLSLMSVLTCSFVRVFSFRCDITWNRPETPKHRSLLKSARGARRCSRWRRHEVGRALPNFQIHRLGLIVTASRRQANPAPSHARTSSWSRIVIAIQFNRERVRMILGSVWYCAIICDRNGDWIWSVYCAKKQSKKLRGGGGPGRLQAPAEQPGVSNLSYFILFILFQSAIDRPCLRERIHRERDFILLIIL